MKLRSKFYFILFAMMSVVTSCLMKREHMYHFSNLDSLYFDIYDTLRYYTFQTNNGIDTLWFINKKIEENYNEWHFDMNEGAVFNAYFSINGFFKHKGCSEKISILYKKECYNQDPTMNIILAERHALSIKDARNFVNGIYKDTITVDNGNSRQNNNYSHCFTFDFLQWHKYKGIIAYKLSDGTIYGGQSQGQSEGKVLK